jgi:hypothetical protein
VTERERIALLDFCTQKFQAEHCFVGRATIGAPPVRRVPLMPAKRMWASIGFSGFKLDYSDNELIAVMNGQRSDGQMFAVTIPLPAEFEPEGDRVEYVNAKIKEAFGELDAYKDCSCGIIGYEKTEEKDDDGDYLFRSICSPCEQHPVVIET